ncbi:amino acid ABC transporter permease [Variovorax sp. KK3]|uniref:amino acid ABC transporter permease n=1 Tax=Variovorax sp. KK3 TaxID=1855728 RepID=UPI00097C06F6|nr:amino acid ABC transporter permease [Variovorax sp. KK3]
MVILDNLRFLLLGTFPNGPIGGLALTVLLSLFVGAGAFCYGVMIAALSLSSSRWIAGTTQLVTTLVRSLPSLVFLFWLYFLLPAILNVQFTPLQSAVIALSIYQGSFIGEDLRAGLLAVARGQREAGAATGLSPVQIFLHIRLPQAVRATVPALVNRYINLFLYTSTASVVGVLEFTGTVTLVNNRLLTHPIQIFGFAALVYFVFCYAIASFGRYLEGRWNWAPKITRSQKAV